MNFCSDKRLDSIFSLLSDPVVHCERVASVQTPSISRAGGPLVTSPSQYTKYKYNAKREASACSKRDAIPSYHHDGSRTRFHPPPCRNGICLVFWCRTGGRRVSHAPSPPPGTRAADQAVLYRGWRDHCRTTATLQLQCVLPADVSAVSRVCSTHTLVLAAGVARDCQPGRRGPSISRDIISGADTLTSRGHTRDTSPGKNDMHTLKVLPHSRFPETRFGA